MKRLAFLFSLFFFLLAGCRSAYVIQAGFDFATGELVTAKYWRNEGAGKLDDTPVLIERSPGYSEYYKKYNLSYPEPILIYGAGTFYPADPDGWGAHWDGHSAYFEFMIIISKFSPPPEEAQKMFKDCIELYKSKADEKTVDTYFREHNKYLIRDEGFE